MWLITSDEDEEVLFSDAQDILFYIESFAGRKTFTIKWIAIYEKAKESETATIIVSRATEAVPLSRSKEKD